jgi:hypothetical protein
VSRLEARVLALVGRRRAAAPQARAAFDRSVFVNGAAAIERATSATAARLERGALALAGGGTDERSAARGVEAKDLAARLYRLRDMLERVRKGAAEHRREPVSRRSSGPASGGA